jgi:hypothetical protein
MKELSFAWGALGGAVISDLALALRNVYSKQRMDKPAEERGDLSPANMFGVLTCLSAAVSLPFALLIEGRTAPAVWVAAVAAVPGGAPTLIAQICAAGLFFYGYSEVAMQALANVHPVTHAIGNTMRRVVIMVVSMVVFRTPMTPLGAAGSAMAIIGAFAYAMVQPGKDGRETPQGGQGGPPLARQRGSRSARRDPSHPRRPRLGRRLRPLGPIAGLHPGAPGQPTGQLAAWRLPTHSRAA